ncbi:MAG TPA: hypothetical protein VM143_08385 [Acidimicrobiales bacterium]|nr:hypothetical protein [Acidimicrobiales bacterium]
MAGNALHDAAPTERDRRAEAAVAVFGTWMLIGLFLDGWAHQASKPETFFSPWHLLLYSGFVAAVAWFGWDGRRAGAASPGDRWMTAGLVMFITGAVGDGIWHEVFGVEVDLEALLSPTHLLLVIGGFLMVTLPVRLSFADEGDNAAHLTWSAIWPQVVTLTLATSVIGFFTMYLSAFTDEPVAATAQMSESLQALGVAKVLVTNALLVVPAVLALRRWALPAGALLVLWTAVSVALSGLDGFHTGELMVAPIGGAVVFEVLRPRVPLIAAAAGASLAFWSTYVAVVAATSALAWAVELWAGAIVLATASSALVVTVLGPPVPRR